MSVRLCDLEGEEGDNVTLNKTAIEWTDATWNPVTGCKHGCPYCYARKIAERFKGTKAWLNGFEPTFHPERLRDPYKAGTKWYCPEALAKGLTIFVGSMADLFGDWVPYDWQQQVFDACIRAKRHTYIFLTKNPSGMKKALEQWISENPRVESEITNWWFGVSCSSDDDSWRIDELRTIPSKNLFVSFEPLLLESHSFDLTGIKQVIVGAQTNPSVEVTPEMLQPIGLATCPGVVPIIKMFCKNSMPKWACRKELCWSVHKNV